MDSNNWRPTQGAEPPMDTADWRTQLQADSRHRIVNKIMETLKRHLPFSGQEGLQELKKIAVRFEEKIYTAATSQSDYLRKISLKMLTMENKSNPMPNAIQSNSAVNSKNSPDPASQGMQSQVNNPGQSLPIPVPNNQSQPGQQLLSQNNMHNSVASTGLQGPGSLNPGLPPSSSLSQSSMPNVGGQNSNMQNIQNISGVPQNSLGNSMGGQGVPSNIYASSQRIPGRQQPGVPQQQQSQNSQFLYQQQQQQLQQQLLKQKLQQGNNPHSVMQSHMQQQQQQQNNNLLQQPSQLQSSQQSVMQQPPAMQSSSGLTHNQQGSVQQQSAQSVLQQHPQSVLRQQRQQQQAPVIHQQQTLIQQPPILPTEQLMGQQQNTMQQSQLIGQQNNISDMQQQQQQQRLIGQQNNLSNLQHQQQLRMGQQNNVANMQQQLGTQSNLSGLQQQQQQLLGTSGNSSMQTNQHPVHMVQSKVPIQQQQNPQSNSTLLPTQGQQSQPQLQQQMASQMQSQPGQLQQQPNSLQRDMQQRIQTQGTLLQPQNMIDQQKQQQQQHLFQQQRPMPEASSTSLDSTAGNANGGDWQEEIYQKIKSMKEMYFVELSEMYQKISGKLQQHDSLPQQPKNEQLEKFKMFKSMLERFITFLQLSKSQILAAYKEKLAPYEKQIIHVLNSNRPRKPVTMQPTQGLPPPHMHLMQQSQQQPHENQMNMQQNSLTNLQHNSLSPLPGVSNSQQNMNSVQSGPNLDPGQNNNAMNSLQQVASGSLQQNPVGGPHQVNMNSLSSQSGMNTLQPNNLNPLQSNLQHQQIKQEQIMQSHQLKQQMQHRQMHQQFLQKQHLLQQQQQQQQQQQFHQQTKQQQPAQLVANNQMPQLHQMTDDLKMRQQMGVKPGSFQQHHSTGQQRSTYHHQQMKTGAPFSISSPQLQTGSPQLNQHPSPQIDQQNLLNSLTKAGTPLQSANSPFIVPSPSTPLAPSPMPGESEKVNSGISSLSNAGPQQTGGALVPPGQSLAIGTPGISASPLLAEFTSPDGNHGNGTTAVSGKSSVTEQPLERLLKAVKSMSPKALSASVSDIGSVVSMIDRIAGSAPGNGSRAAVGEDLVAMTKCRLQARNFITQDGTNNGTRKMKRYTSAMPLNVVSSAGSMNDSFKQLTGSEASDLESTATSNIKKPRLEANHALMEEIREINQRLIDTVVDISDEDIDPTAAAAVTDNCEGTIVKCSFNAVALSPNLKSQYASAQMSPIQPLRLLVPTNYPNCSPVLLDKFPVEAREHEDLSVKAKSRFSISLRGLSQPMSLGEIARTWDICARAVISEYAQQSGGGSFSSKYGTWENCLSTA